MSKTLFKHIYPGKKIYVVKRADIQEYIVTKEKPWVYGSTGSLVYRLQNISSRLYSTLAADNLDEEIGSINRVEKAFTNKLDAERAARNYIKQNKQNMLFLHDEDFSEKHIYQFVRSLDGRLMKAYYCITKDKKLAYVKEFYTYRHVVEHNRKNFDSFMQDVQTNKGTEQYKGIAVKGNIRNKETRIDPVYMYRCNNTDWIYAEADYQSSYFGYKVGGQEKWEK